MSASFEDGGELRLQEISAALDVAAQNIRIADAVSRNATPVIVTDRSTEGGLWGR